MKLFKLPAPISQAMHHTGQRATQTGRWVSRLALRALDSIQEVLRAEIENGHVRLVADFLSDKALPAAKALLLERMTARLLLRLGLRGTLLTSVAGWILPFVLEKLFQVAKSSGLLAKLEANPTVTEGLLRLDELRQRVARALYPDGDTSAEELPAVVAATPGAEPPASIPPA